MARHLVLALAAAATLAGLAAASPVAAATVLDPSDTVGAGRVRLDGAAALTLSRDLHLEEPDLTVEASARTFGIGGSVGLLEGLDGFLALGATRLALEESGAIAGRDFDGDVGFAFGGGLRYRFIDERYFKVGASLSVVRHESSDRDVTATWLEGDVLLGASLHAFRYVVPFVGMAAGFVDGTFDGPFGRRDFRQEDVVGAFAGVRYAATSQVEASLAGRLFDREELLFTLSFGF